MTADLTAWIAEDAARPVAPAVTSFAAKIAARGGASTAAVLFYGSALRTGELDGVLDFYVVVDSLLAWHRSRLAALANLWLPPTVEFWQHSHEGQPLRAKVAILRRDQLLSRTRFDSLDTTIWARFCQPSALVWARDDEARGTALRALAQAFTTASRWAFLLGPERGRPEDYWQALFRHTLAAELRVETASRAGTIVGFAPQRYFGSQLAAAWMEAGLSFRQEADGTLLPNRGTTAGASWQARRLLGKPLNVLRLVKAAFSFEGGVDYILWKIERHTGVVLPLTPWQRRHPVLASPLLVLRLWRAGAVR